MIVTVTLCLAGALSSNALNAASPGGAIRMCPVPPRLLYYSAICKRIRLR